MGKPQVPQEKIWNLLTKLNVDISKEEFVLVGVRGYFLDTMGKKGKNDIGIFDDGFIWIGKNGEFATFNGNTDPSSFYKNVATLKTGIWTYKKGYHGYGRPTGHMAFRQAAPVVVLRWQREAKFMEEPLGDTINIHRGGQNTTSSAGCQTLPPNQWESFKAYGYTLLERYKKTTFKYVLVENDGTIA